MATVDRTELTRVNNVLAAVGMGPVSTLDQTREAQVARDTLTEVDVEIQSRGWHFNTEREVTIAPDTSTNIPVPTDALRIDPEDPTLDFVQRGGVMFDRENNTTTINRTADYKIVRFLDFEDLPVAAQEYITARAARLFQDRLVGSSDADRRLERIEGQKYGQLLIHETETATANPFFSNFSVWRVRGGPRRNPLLETGWS